MHGDWVCAPADPRRQYGRRRVEVVVPSGHRPVRTAMPHHLLVGGTSGRPQYSSGILEAGNVSARPARKSTTSGIRWDILVRMWSGVLQCVAMSEVFTT